jgi:2,3-bisphosphoglycerate-independent phosphoglycerate mutase
MKYLVLIPDGMADRPFPALGGKTPMEVAEKPMMDELAQKSYCATVLNVPPGMVPESDTANLAIMSYDPAVYSKGRSPLEAMSMGLELRDGDVAIRCNLVSLSEDEECYEERHMLDHSSDEISTEEADELVKALNEALPMEGRRLYTGISYRHCLVWHGTMDKYDFTRPHDIIGRVIGDLLPRESDGGGEYLDFMKKSYDVLVDHPVNRRRRARGLKAANSAWLWSPGTKPALPSFTEKWGLKATVISAVDLIKGIGICAGMDVVDVPGATGNYKTNYEGKANAAIKAFKDGSDFVYVHVEAPDECGHRGEWDIKPLAISKISELILRPVYEYLASSGEDFRIMVLPDHPTPLEIRTHSSESVPYFIYDSRRVENGVECFTEAACEAKNDYLANGYLLLDKLIER